MNDKDREMLIETHAFCKQNHKALYGNGKAGLIEEMAEARGAYKTLRNVGVCAVAVIGVVITVLEII